jgi:hypothetical protein
MSGKPRRLALVCTEVSITRFVRPNHGRVGFVIRPLHVLTDSGEKSFTDATGLHEVRLVGIAPQSLSHFADCGVDAAVRRQMNVLTPNPFDNLVAGDQLAPLLHEKQQKLHGNAFELQPPARTAKFVAANIQL